MKKQSLREKVNRTSVFKTTIVLSYDKSKDKNVMKHVRAFAKILREDDLPSGDVYVTTEGTLR